MSYILKDLLFSPTKLVSRMIDLHVVMSVSSNSTWAQDSDKREEKSAPTPVISQNDNADRLALGFVIGD